MKAYNTNTKKVSYGCKYPNQASHSILAQKLMDGIMMFACCTGAISIMTFLMVAF